MSHDYRKHAGGGPEVLGESMADHAAAGVPGPRIIPSPEEARRAQEAAMRAASGYVQPVVPSVYAEAGWESRIRRENGGRIPLAQEAANSYPRIMPEREATIRAQEALAARMYGQAQGVDQMPRAPGKRFSREVILAVIAAERTKWVPEPTEIGGARYRAAMQALDELQRIFENLE